MAKQLLARGQATIQTLNDAYTLNQSVSSYVFAAASNGTITSAVAVTSTIKVMMGEVNVTDFTIGTITKPTGFSSITVNNSNKTIAFTIAANTTNLSDTGIINIPISVADTTYNLSFTWSKTKDGATGPAGVDSNLLDWVDDWNTNKTVIGTNSVITPKIFAGNKNTNGTITGIALGRFSLNTLNTSGTVVTETIDGIYGFKDGSKTFFIDNGGNAQLGRGTQYIKYNASTGKVEFGSDVSLNWIGATYIDANGIFTGTLSATQITAGTIDAARINVDALKASLITSSNIEALTLNVVRGKIGGFTIDADSIYSGTKNNTAGAYTYASSSITIGSNGIRGYKWRLDSNGAGAIAGGNISWDTAGNISFGDSVRLQWTSYTDNLVTTNNSNILPKLTQINASGIYTGAINANQITAGSILASQLDAASIKANIINTNYINGLSCTFSQGQIGGWTITSDTIYNQKDGKTIVIRSSEGKSSILPDYGRQGITLLLEDDLINSDSVKMVQLGIIAKKDTVSSYDSTPNYGFRIALKDGIDIFRADKKGIVLGGWNVIADTIYCRNNGKNVIIRSGDAGSTIMPDYGRQGVTIYIDDSGLDAGGIKIVQMGSLPKKNTTRTFEETPNYGFRMMTKEGKDIFRADKDGAVIAGWNIDTDSIYNGTKTNTIGLYTGGTGYITIGSAGIRGWKWRLEANGSGAIAGGNISWDTSGNVTFTSSVSLNWTTPINNIVSALGGSTYLKLTQISSTGIYTGTLNANQITVGSILASQLNAESIKSNIINTDYISGLACNFVRGTIGGWKITDDTIYQNTYGRYVIFRTTEGLASVVPLYGRRGLTIYTEDEYLNDGAVKIVQMGMLSDKNTAQTYSSSASYGFRIMLKGSRDIFRADQNGVMLAGWNVDQESIYKGTKSNSPYSFTEAGASITIGTRGIRGYQWRLESDGAGALAGGNISWNTLGKVTFAESVSLNWTKYTDNKVDAIDVGARNYALETSNAWTPYTDLSNIFNQCILPYKVLTDTWKKGDTILVTFDYKYANIAKSTEASEVAIQGSGDVTEWGVGGFNYTSFIDKIDFVKKSGSVRISYSFVVTADHIKNSYFSVNFRHDYLVGRVYIKNLKVEKGTKATDWSPAPEDVSSRLTKITSNGIYTGYITASQINVDSALVVGGSAYNGSISVRDASNSVKVTLDRNGINAVAGYIGGWAILSDRISKNSVVLGADGSITNGTRWALNIDGSGYVANGNISWNSSGNVTVTGTINATTGQIGGFEISYGRIGSVATGDGGGGSLAIYSDLFRVGSSTSYVLFGDNTFPAYYGGYSAGRVTNNKSNAYFSNYGIYMDVTGGNKNFGIWSNAALLAPSHISNKIKVLVFNGSGYSIDFSQNNLFLIYATANFNVTLPTESSVAYMFDYSTLPSDFACVFTFIYQYDYGNKVVLQNIRNNDGNVINYEMTKGDVVTVLCSKYPIFHYQILVTSRSA